jgi:hypothetical protein
VNGGGRWLGWNAVLWVFYEAPDVPAHLLSALLVYAAHAGTDGRGAYPSASTVAMLTRKTERNAKKDIAELVRLGLLLPGNQRMAAHIRADKRPSVYDLPMPERGASRRPPSQEPRGVAHDTPPSPNGVSHTTARGVAQGPDGVSHTTPEEFLKNSGRARASASADGARTHAQPQPCDRCGGDGHNRSGCPW